MIKYAKIAEYRELMDGCEDELDAIENLRLFCSLAMSGQDWLDVEQFFITIVKQRDEANAEIARLNHQHKNDEAANRMLSEACNILRKDRDRCGRH